MVLAVVIIGGFIVALFTSKAEAAAALSGFAGLIIKDYYDDKAGISRITRE